MAARCLTRPSFWFALLAALALAPMPARAQMLDVNSNGISDVWELLYGAQDCDPAADPDGDGVPNWQEALAGTDPFDAQSVPRISQISVTPAGVQVIVPGALGKKYELQACEMICGSASSNWVTETSLVARTNPIVTLTGPADRPMKFYRVVISDVDTDGDGLNDWEEYQLGLDPFNPTSNGHVDGNGTPLTDLQFARNRLLAENLMSLLTRGRTGSTHKTAVPLSVLHPTLIIYPAAVASGTGLTGQYFTNASGVYSDSVNFNPTNLFLTTNDATIDFIWGPGSTPNLSNTWCTVRWTGQVEPAYSETYIFQTSTDDGVRLWVNDQLLIDQWSALGLSTWTNVIQLQAGVRYDLRMEYLNQGGSARARLFWYSPSQARQIIPSTQLYPASGGLDPGGITSPLNAVAFVGQPFTYTITAANSPLGFSVSNVPPGLAFNPSSATLNGVPTVAGDYQVGLIVSNTIATTNAILDLQVIDTGSAVSREIWLNVPGTSVTNIPVDQPPSLTNTLPTLTGITNFGDNYGERIRGWLTAPVTGNYYFWLFANNSAQLWISDDDEPANRILRAFVSPKKSGSSKNVTLPANQRSPWLSLVAGQRYYIEILHKAAKGANDGWSVDWLLDPAGTNSVPGPVVPGFVLSPYVPPTVAQIPGTLYSANMVAQANALSSGVGSATLRLSADGSQAVLRFSYGGLSSTVTGQHIHNDAYLSNPSSIIFDIDAASPQPDGSYLWNIAAVGTLSAADIQEIIREGKAYINIHTVNYPEGEINGHFTLAAGTSQFVPPPLPPVWKDDHSNSNAAARFLTQATFGPQAADLKAVRSMGYENWIKKQFKLPISSHLANVFAGAALNPNAGFSSSLTFNTWWQESVTAPDQLRQRVAFALSEIMVVSENGVLSGNALALSSYYDLLLKHAFGNFRDLLDAVTLSPAMGIYLDMRSNDKANVVLGTHPNENYAREIMQLFSIGLNRMWPDGSLILDSQGNLVPTYDQNVIQGYARVFTGWNYYQTNQANKRLPKNWYPQSNYTNTMVLVPTHHELGTKLLLDHIVLPAAQGSQASPTNSDFDTYSSNDLDLALDAIFNNPNVGPFICRQLIQRLVTSHPSRDYVYRVVEKFNDNGAGVRGDMQAVIKAILLDYEARSPDLLQVPAYGKQREPVLRATALARAFPSPPPLRASYKQSGTPLVTITTPKGHRLASGDDVFLSFTGGAGPQTAPASQIYYNVTVTNDKSFTVVAPGIAVGTYSQAGSVITVTNSGNGLTAGNEIYLSFPTGGARPGIYTVVSVVSSSVFTVTATDSASRSGQCLFPTWSGTTYNQTNTSITFTTWGPHGLSAGNPVYVNFGNGTPSPDGVYKVARVLGANRFTANSTVSTNYSGYNVLVLPLVAAPANRAGGVTIRYSSWNMGYTDSGSSSSLAQTPLDSPTVFNFYFPDYKYPGILASAGLTTPEFQLTSDTGVILQMNFMSGAVFSSSGNTNGLSSFTGGSGAIMLDIGPWMTPNWTSDANIPSLVDALSTLLCGGNLSADAKTIIAGYAANDINFPYTTPTAAQMRNRVRAVVHLIVSSPDFAIQR